MIKKPNKLIQYISIALGAVLACGVFMSSTNFSLSNVLRSRASEAISSTITFLGSKSSKSGVTNTTVAQTSTGGTVICKTTYNDTTISQGYIGAVRNTSTIKFYEADGATEYTFEDLDKITLYFEYATTNFTINYTYDTGATGSIDYSNKSGESRYADFSGASYGNVSNINYDWKTSSAVKITKIEIKYNCSPKAQTGLVISSSPTKTVYNEGEKFSDAGMVVKAVYSNDKQVATKSYTFSPTRSLVPTDTEIIVSFGGFSTSIPIVVNEVTFEGTYSYSSSPSTYSLTINEDGTGVYIYTNSSYSQYNGQQHFTWSVSGNKITFTRVIDPSDYVGDTGSYYYLFTKSGSYNTTNTGDIVGVTLKIYTCGNSMRTSTAKTLAK